MDLSSWHGILVSIGGLALVTLIGVGIRLLVMMTIQQRRERMNRQINERLSPAINQVMNARGANLAVDFDATLARNATLDVTNEVLAALNAALPSVSLSRPTK